MPALDLLDTLTETEARIIAENATHAVIAIRIEKTRLRDLMQRNGPFIAALCDLTPALVPPSPPGFKCP